VKEDDIVTGGEGKSGKGESEKKRKRKRKRRGHKMAGVKERSGLRCGWSFREGACGIVRSEG
jgi:hypothetical protein